MRMDWFIDDSYHREVVSVVSFVSLSPRRKKRVLIPITTKRSTDIDGETAANGSRRNQVRLIGLAIPPRYLHRNFALSLPPMALNHVPTTSWRQHKPQSPSYLSRRIGSGKECHNIHHRSEPTPFTSGRDQPRSTSLTLDLKWGGCWWRVLESEVRESLELEGRSMEGRTKNCRMMWHLKL